MGYLAAAVVLVGALGLLNLLLTITVIRRLRQHPAVLGGGRSSVERGLLPVGATITGFSSRTVDGDRITGTSFESPTLVTLFSTDCGACTDEIPLLVAWLDRHRYARNQALAVVTGDPGLAKPFVQALRDRVALVVEPIHGPVSTAFATTAFPACYLVDGTGTVLAAATTLDELAGEPVGVGGKPA
jgi:hypothetical protein